MSRLSQSYSIPTDIAAVERLLAELEPRLERLSGLASRTSSDLASAAGQAAARGRDAVTRAFGDIADDVGRHARTTGNQAARLGKDLAGKVAEEVEYRPIASLLVAVGIGLLLGMGMTRR